jgi:hypothetical protein
LEEPVSKGIFKGEKIDLGRFGSMLDEYYQFRDWDHVTGWPFKETALSYGLYDQVAALERTGRHLPEKNTPEQNKNQYSADLLT